MYSENIQRQIIHWNIHTLNSMTSFVDLLHRHQHKNQPNTHDHRLRDFYYNPNLDLFGMKKRKSFIQQSAEVIQNFMSFNQLGYLQSVHFNHLMQKHRFWSHIYQRPCKTKADYEMRQSVRSIAWTYRIFPLFLFTVATVIIFRLSGLYKLRIQKQLVGLGMGAFMADYMFKAKKSSDIFYLIPQLEDPQFQKQRIDIINKSVVLDGRINAIQDKPKYIEELIYQAQKEKNQGQRIAILEAAGFKVVMSKDQEYI